MRRLCILRQAPDHLQYFIRGAFIVVWLYFPFRSRFCGGRNLLADNIVFTNKGDFYRSRFFPFLLRYLQFLSSSKTFLLFDAVFRLFFPNFWHDLRTRRPVNKMDAHARSVKTECFVTGLRISGNFNSHDLGLDSRVSGSSGMSFYTILEKRNVPKRLDYPWLSWQPKTNNILAFKSGCFLASHE